MVTIDTRDTRIGDQPALLALIFERDLAHRTLPCHRFEPIGCRTAGPKSLSSRTSTAYRL